MPVLPLPPAPKPVTTPATIVVTEKDASVSESDQNFSSETPRGVPVSGRAWKSVQKTRTSVKNNPKAMSVKNMGVSFKVAQVQKAARLAAKSATDRLKELRQERLNEVREKRIEKQKRKAENQLKATQYQTIDANKLKKMNKKQLRQIKKTRMNKHGVVELVNAYD